MPEWLAKVWELAWEFWAFWTKDTQGLYHLAWIVGGAIGIPLLYIRTRAAEDQAKAALKQSETAAERHKQQTDADRDRRITESFAKAVELLGDDKLEVRLGGIYTLERIAQKSERDYWPIMETLTAYVRERAPWPPLQAVANPFVELQSSAAVDETAGESASKPETETEPANRIRPKTDIQAVLTVLGRRRKKARRRDQEAGRHLDLEGTDLRGAYLREAHLEGAWLSGAHLDGASLRKAHLEGASLVKTHLKGATTILVNVHLEGAHLWDAHLERARLECAYLNGAHLVNAHLEGAFLGGADLEGAWLGGAHLEGANLGEAKNLTQGQVNAAMGDDRTRLPEGLTRPANWPKAEADDEGDSER